jgi:hypothetical protein
MLTLGNQRGLSQDFLTSGIIESITSVNQFYKMLPFAGIHGNALAYNREDASMDAMNLVGVLNTGHSSINKDAQTFTRHSTELTSIIGDAQVNGLIQAVGSDHHDATAVQVAAKAKGLGRTFMNLLINGNNDAGFSAGDAWTSKMDIVLKASLKAADYAKVDTASETDAVVSIVVDGIIHTGPFTAAGALTTEGATLMNAASVIAHGFKGFDGIEKMVNGKSNDLTGNMGSGNVLDKLDIMIDRVKDKDGMVDYLMMNSSAVRKFSSALRTIGALDTTMEVKTSSGGVMAIQSYRGVPIFRNDFVGSANGVDTATDVVYAGTLDDGSFTHGISGLTASKSAGVQVQKIGAREDVDAEITRVKWYTGLANFSELGLVKGNI